MLLCGYSAGSLSASYCEPVPDVKTRYLLISYPLSALWALTLFRTSPFTSKLASIVSNAKVPFLSIRGDRDQFTADNKYKAWEKDLSQVGKNASFVRIEGADHFWSGKAQLQAMLDNVSAWLDRNGEPSSTSQAV